MSFSMNHKDYGSDKKTLIKKEVFWKHQDNQPTWKDIKHIEFQDDDKIAIAYQDYDDESNSDGWVISVERWVEETDEQYEERIEKNKLHAHWLKERRYKNYLSLKEEFGETKCFDRMGVELNEGDTVDVQKAGKHTIYKGIYGDLCFKPYGKEEKVKEYFSNDIEKVL